MTAAIGQSENRFTPLQMAVYTATLANRGIRYKATFLNRIISADYQELLYRMSPQVESRYAISESAYSVYTEHRGRFSVLTSPSVCGILTQGDQNAKTSKRTPQRPGNTENRPL